MNNVESTSDLSPTEQTSSPSNLQVSNLVGAGSRPRSLSTGDHQFHRPLNLDHHVHFTPTLPGYHGERSTFSSPLHNKSKIIIDGKIGSHPTASEITQPGLLPPGPPDIHGSRKAMEDAAAAERRRIQPLEKEEAHYSADELRRVLKRERTRAIRIQMELAALKHQTVSAALSQEILEEGRINGLVHHLDQIKHEKERIIIELEREEEMVIFDEFYAFGIWICTQTTILLAFWM
jgi:hypothetical protein